MKNAFESLIEDVILYNNNSLLILLFLVALVFLWVKEKDRRVKTAFVYIVAALAVIFICPLYAWIGMKVDEEIYYRVFWSLPVGIIVCYAAVRLIMHFKKLFSRVLVGVLVVLTIMINGKFVYTNSLHFKSTNYYHIPQFVMDVADALKMDKYKPIAVLPAELLTFFHQYTGDVFTPYGRNIIETKWNFSNALYDVMEQDIYNAEDVAREARNEHCIYVVLSSAKQIKGSMEEQNYFLKDFVSGYYIYMDRNYYEVLKEQNLLDDDFSAVSEY